MESALARGGRDHRLIGELDTALVQRGDDLVGNADVDAALRVARGIGTPGRERTHAALFCGIQRLMGAIDGLVGVAGIARHADRADRSSDRHRAGFGRHHLVADTGEEALGGDVHVVNCAVLQD
ncbi:NAD(P)-dependent dehydrogenase (short-subunit alcohol dehydrogenase family) [Bradyrhizobium sp. LM6.9]